ncbi:glycosyltransferase family 2 protein [Gloeocapsopsis dulcis]|uniref:Glycosyl transferase n=1 Tax=Gloeocapsopsis dulcis AAB1 = 1H9 TaxID=1433147 RepID=A0A6N8FU99_9CHRO|nr:glycosyltransferase [Gloeocapsopsis dulcis]MUL36683.1 glycosyl transferase [Gloeocapsopsis dulcis AAB1 = 1H9]WNN91257.1 glycosyltransferase [Gloeocapsopsis dulcis]
MIYFLTVNYYSTSLIAKLITSIQNESKALSKVVIVNNSADDFSIRSLQSESVAILEAGKNLGFGSACNLGLQWIYAQNQAAIIWIINPDTYFLEDVQEKVNCFFATYPEVSILGTIIYTPDDNIWFAGGHFRRATGAILPQDILSHSDTAYIQCEWVSGCSFILNCNNFTQCPQFNPVYFLYYEDFDFCQTYAQRGHIVAVTKLFRVIHQPSSITNQNVFNKIKYSTYSYLITLEKYSNRFILFLRLTRLIFYAFVLVIVKPKVAFGKIYGTLLYLRHLLSFCKIPY